MAHFKEIAGPDQRNLLAHMEEITHQPFQNKDTSRIAALLASSRNGCFWWDIAEKSLTIVCEPIVPLSGLIL